MPGRSATAKLELGRASFPAAAVALALLGQRGAINLALATAVVYALRMLALPRELDWSLLGAAAVLAWGNALSLYSHVLYLRPSRPLLRTAAHRAGPLFPPPASNGRDGFRFAGGNAGADLRARARRRSDLGDRRVDLRRTPRHLIREGRGGHDHRPDRRRLRRVPRRQPLQHRGTRSDPLEFDLETRG